MTISSAVDWGVKNQTNPKKNRPELRKSDPVNGLEIFEHFSLSLYSIKILLMRAGLYNMLFRKGNRKVPGQTALQSDQGLHCLSRSFYRQLAFKILEH